MTDNQTPAELLRDGQLTAIAELNPEVSDQNRRVVDGTITITWPFSVLNKSIAFLLAERDFRLRREKGQVRIRFHGASAKAISDASLGGGDEIRLSLEGVKWEKNETQTQVAGSTLEWQLEFNNRLILGIRKPDSEQEEVINIDTPATEPETTNGDIDSVAPVDITISNTDFAIPSPQSPNISLPAKRNASEREPEEFSSPAFLKRARVSYGGLFEGGLDIFDEEITKKAKSKKRSRFSLPANAWRYASHSPSPEPDEASQEADDAPQTNGSLGQNGTVEDTPMPTPPRPSMIDQGCQTVDVDFTPMASVQVLAESRPAFGFPQATPTPLPRTKPIETDNALLGHSLQFQGDTEGHQHLHPETHPDLLSHSPNHIDTGLTFGFTPQTVLFPSAPGLFSADHDQDAAPESPSRGARAEDYPAEFLDTTHLPPESTVSHPSLSGHESHISPQPTDHQVSFDSASTLHPVFGAPSRSPQPAWAPEVSAGSFSTAIARSDVDNPVEILSSSPSREGSPRPFSPSGEDMAEDAAADVSPEPALEEPSSEAEHYRDGGDEPGDDYDLRNYDRAHDDDDDVQSSEEEDLNNNDVEAQIMNPEEDEADEDEELAEQEQQGLDEEPDEYEEEMYEEGFEGEGQEYEGSDGDAEGEYYSGEEGSYDEEEEEEEEEEDDGARAGPTGRFAPPSEPVFISLLSDSEDEEEDKDQSHPEQGQNKEPEQEFEREPEAESKSEPKQNPELTQESAPEQKEQPESNSAPKPELEPEPEPEQEEPEPEQEEPEPEQEEPENPPEEKSKEEKPEEDVTAESVAQPEPESKPEAPAEKSPRADLDEANQVDEIEVTTPSKAKEPDNARGSAEPSTGEMEVDTEPSRLEATDASKDHDHDSAPHDKEIPDEESAHQAPVIQSPQSVPAQGSQAGQVGEPEAAPENEISTDVEMDDAPVLAEESKDKPENKTTGMNDSDGAHPVTATTEEQAEAMDVDETHQAPEEPTTTVSLEIADTTTVVGKEVDGTIAESAQGPLGEDKDKVTPVEAPAGEEAFAETRSTPENGVEPSKSPTAPAAGVALAGEKTGVSPDDREAVVEARESQDQGPAESPDATMQDASSELIATAQQQPTGAVDQTGHGEGEGAKEAGSDEQLATHGQMSPPPTQFSQAQASQDTNKEAPLLSQATSIISNDHHDAHLPTPGETQQEIEVEMAVTITTATTNQNMPVEEDDVGPEDQIMAEILQHSPVRPDTTLQLASPAVCSPTASVPKSSPQTMQTEELHETPSRTTQRAPEAAPVAKSLRSRRHRSSKSSDHADLSQADPSILLAIGSAAPTHGDGHAKHSSPTGSVRVTRSRAEQNDPSLQLVRASAQADEGKGRGKRKAADSQTIASAENSSPGSLRVTRQRVEDDPSIRLIKASSPSTRQTRSRRTSDHRRETPKRETRSTSRSLQLRGDTPGASSVALKSPSIAGSAATAAEDENVGTVKLQLLRNLRTTMPDYLSLKSLRHSLNKTADILAIATATPEKAHRPKHGPRDYMLTLNLTDPSMAPSGVCVAHIFRPHLAAMPAVHIGDVVLLRRFQVVSMKGRGFGLRAGDASAWAVFEKAGVEMEPQVKGPPVELTADDVKYAEGLRRWWSLLDDKAMEKIERASRKVTEAGKDDTK
ncbi:Telo-bind domain-containing protein [Fusarium sp. LHS14.1]|nr:Telo-bind domain-containing protein [Fusarium sp. LHS14.1]